MLSQKLEPYLLKGVRRTAECKRLGNGSFGVVDELYVQGTLCAAKQLHGLLLDPRTEGVDRVISRFVEECHIMASVRHPNIVQFLGLHIFPNSTHPTLVMEKLAMSLEDLLNEANKKREDIPLSLKVSILSDTAKGLVYLHNHKPQIIHRDLTSRNILLTLAMQAKITDLGNALIIDSNTVAMTMTQTPGTAVYMPPEAVHTQARYDSTIDMFSYGHLALYTIIQEFPRDLLPATYMDESKRQLCARSEIQRREKYIGILHQKMGKGHLLTHVIERCLDNLSDERPSALQVLENLEETSKTIKSSQDDYHDFQHTNKLDLVKMFKSAHRDRAESASSTSQYVYMSIGPERKPAEDVQLVDEDSPTTAATSIVLDRSEQIKIGVPGKLMLCKGGTLRKSGSRGKDYTFKISTSESTASLVYYDEKIRGVIHLSNITDVRTSSQDDSKSDNSFIISTKRKEEKLRLIASSQDEHDSWVKALTQLISPGVASKPLQIVTSSHEQDNQSDIPIIGAHSSTLIRPQCTFTPPESKRLSTVTLPDLSSSNPTLRKTKSANKLRLSLQDDSGYEPIDSVTEDITLNSNPSYSPFSTFHGKSHHGSSSIINPKSVSTESSQEEGCIPAQSAADHLHQHTQSKSDPPPESTMAVSRTLSNLSRFSPDQMEHLIDMLRMITPQPQNGNSPIPEHEAAPGSRLPSRPLKPTKHSLILPKVSGSASLAKFRERPSQLTDLFKSAEKEEEMEKEREGLSPKPPTLQMVVEPAVKGSALLAQRRRSTGMLNIVETPPTVKFKLARLLSESDGASKASLLVTGESPEGCEERPDWAKASRVTAPTIKVHSPSEKDDSLSLLRRKALFMERSDLQDLEEIGEGQFGKIYKATLVRGKSEKMTVAVKTIKKYKSEQETSNFLHEMGVMMDLIHPNVVHLYGIVQQESPRLVLQYLPNGDLKNYLIKNERSVDQLIKYMIDVAMGMHYIVERGLVHRDLAARNVMVDDRETCKVADFGLLREIPKDDTIYQATTGHELPWPIRWMAPESLENREFSPATDVWSFGVLLWEMYYPNQEPYVDLSNIQVLSKVLSGFRLPIPIKYPSTVAKIMKACWQKEPEKRPSFLLISQTLLTSY